MDHQKLIIILVNISESLIRETFELHHHKSIRICWNETIITYIIDYKCM